MKITKWKSISQWKPSTLTLEQVENFVCEIFNDWSPGDIINQVNFTVRTRKSGVFKDKIVEEVMHWNQVLEHPRISYRVELSRNPFLKSVANGIFQRIADRIAISNEWPIDIGEDFIFFLGVYLMDMPPGGFEVPKLIWLFKGDVYLFEQGSDVTNYSFDQVQLMIYECHDKDRQKWEDLSRKYDPDYTGQESYQRERIPESVRIEVWRRDGGICARSGCGVVRN